MLKRGAIAAGSLCGAFMISLCHAEPLKTLYTFKGGNMDGAAPLGGLTLDGETLYGTTYLGGSHLSGTIFQIDLHGNYKSIRDFAGRPTDGAGPYAAMTLVGHTLYGTTSAGGKEDFGTIFSYNPATTEYKLLYSFTLDFKKGRYPDGQLLRVGKLLYGTTNEGGNKGCSNLAGCGTLFSFDPATNSLKILYSFSGGADGGTPRGNLVLFNNAIFGVTSFGGTSGCYGGTGCGTIFRYSLDNSAPKFRPYPFRPLEKPNDGTEPKFGLTVANGMLYGTTFDGGKNDTASSPCYPFGCGTIFSFNPQSHSGDETPLFYKFKGATGTQPSSGLTVFDSGKSITQPRGYAVGTTLYGGDFSSGTIYLTDLASPSTTPTPLYSFTGGKDGANPRGTLVLVGNSFYGVTYEGGEFDSGTIFRYDLSKP
jgi:uncharacterized repeat protein (TIGR03803 family)